MLHQNARGIRPTKRSRKHRELIRKRRQHSCSDNQLCREDVLNGVGHNICLCWWLNVHATLSMIVAEKYNIILVFDFNKLHVFLNKYTTFVLVGLLSHRDYTRVGFWSMRLLSCKDYTRMGFWPMRLLSYRDYTRVGFWPMRLFSTTAFVFPRLLPPTRNNYMARKITDLHYILLKSC